MKKRKAQLPHQPALAPALFKRFEKVAGGIVISMISKVLADEPQTMLAHPDAVQLWTLVIVAILGALVFTRWCGTAKRRCPAR